MPSYIHVNICICIHTYNLTLHIYIIYTGGVNPELKTCLRRVVRCTGDVGPIGIETAQRPLLLKHLMVRVK